jgi:predicted DNA-binding protein
MDEKKKYTMLLDDDIRKRAEHLAVDMRITLADFIREAIEEKIERVNNIEMLRGK